MNAIKRKGEKMDSIGSLSDRKQNTIRILFLVLVLFTFLPRLFSLSGHWAKDEDLWMQRSRNFFFALKTGQFEDTLVAYHPGITTCWLGSLSIWLTSQQGASYNWFHSGHFMSPGMLARVRFPIVFLSGMLTLIAGVLLHRLFGPLLANIGTLFLAIEPFLLSESRRAHTDVLTALFLFLALLLWICYLEGETRTPRRDIVSSGICFGLACLTKSHAGAFILFLPMLLIWYYYQRHIYASKLVLSVVLWTASTLLTVGIVWPYLWTVKFGNLPLSPFLFLGSGVLLLWSWKKFSQKTDFTFSKTELLLIACSVLAVGIPTLFAAKMVISHMYNALTTSHGLPSRFLGKIRRNPGPVLLSSHGVRLEWTFDTATDPFRNISFFSDAPEGEKDISHCHRDVFFCGILHNGVELCFQKNFSLYCHFIACYKLSNSLRCNTAGTTHIR